MDATGVVRVGLGAKTEQISASELKLVPPSKKDIVRIVGDQLKGQVGATFSLVSFLLLPCG